MKGVIQMDDRSCGFDFTSEKNLQELFASQIDLLATGKTRQCPSLSDELFINACFNRVISQNNSGREFIQKLEEVDEVKVPRTTLSDSMHSPRRLDLIKDVALLNYELLSKQLYDDDVDYLKEFKELNGYDVFSVDGHYIEHCSHAERNPKGKVYAAGNLYALNLRNGLIRHFACVTDGSSKNHEMPIFRNNIENFCFGKKTIWIVDMAFIDFNWWERMTRNEKKDVISKSKGNCKVTYCGENVFDKNDPVNAGVISDKQAAFSSNRYAATFRVIEYIDPETGEKMTFNTTLSAKKFKPGLICWLYFLRWRIEKVYDCFKNSFNETKAWATGKIAMQIQGHSICLLYNFVQFLSEKTKAIASCQDEKSIKKYEKNLEIRETKAKEKGRYIHPLLYTSRKISRMSSQFIRVVRNYFFSGKPVSWLLPKFAMRLKQYL